MLLPLLARLGLFAGLLVSLLLVQQELRKRGTHMEALTSTRGTPASGDEGAGESAVSGPVTGERLADSVTDASSDGVREIPVTVNDEAFVFRFLPGATTVGDLAAEFCRTHGERLGFVGAQGFKRCVLPLVKHLRSVVQDESSDPLLADVGEEEEEEVPAEDELTFVYTINGQEYTFVYSASTVRPHVELAEGFCAEMGGALGIDREAAEHECVRPLSDAFEAHIASISA